MTSCEISLTGTATLTVPKSSAILRGPSASLQIPNPGLSATVNLPLARQPVLQAVKSSTPQAARSPSPAVPQAVPQDLSSRSVLISVAMNLKWKDTSLSTFLKCQIGFLISLLFV